MAPSTTEPKGKQRQPPVVQPGSSNSIIINPCQRLNPVIECIRNVQKGIWRHPTLQAGRMIGILFLRLLRLTYSIHLRTEYYWVALSRCLRYRCLRPEYTHPNIEYLSQTHNLRVLLLIQASL